MPEAGQHKRVSNIGRDVNGLTMMKCSTCEACAHAVNEEQAIRDLSATNCVPNCENCKRLRSSYDEKPAVPEGGSCNDLYHICPRCGNRWWQFNRYYHLWAQVTDPGEWDAIGRQSSRIIPVS